MRASRLAWHGAACDLPPGWEVTAFRLDPARTQFRFHQRLAEAGTLNLVRLPTRPDPAALAGELFARQEGASAGPPTLLPRGPWMIAHGRPGAPWVALAWDAHEGRALHWTFPAWEEAEAAASWHVVLDSLTTGSGDVRTWELFGVSAELPRCYLPCEIEAQPAAVRIDFVADGWAGVSARRYGMAAVLLAQRPLAAWLRRSLLTGGARIEAVQEHTWRGLPAVHATYSVLGERPLDRVAWRRWPGEAWWWHDATTNRIHALEQVGPRRARRVELADAG